MIVPALPSQHFRTFEIIAPLSTHWRPATCEEVGCEAWRNGWVTRVPVGSDLAQYITSGTHGRVYHEAASIDSAEREFMFPPGQKCFAASKHRLPLEREPLYVARGGDARGNPLRERRVHQRPEHWVEDFAENLDRVRESKGE
jgi:hypothetical protein